MRYSEMHLHTDAGETVTLKVRQGAGRAEVWTQDGEYVGIAFRRTSSSWQWGLHGKPGVRGRESSLREALTTLSWVAVHHSMVASAAQVTDCDVL